MNTFPLIRLRFAALATALTSLLAVALGGCMSAPSSSAPSSSAPVVAAAPLASGTGFVYSANEGEDSISRIDLATGQVTTMPVPVTPHNVQISRDGSRLFVVGSMAGQTKMAATTAAPAGDGHAASQQPGGLLILDAAAANAALATLVQVGRAPAHVIVDTLAARAYVSNSDDDSVSVVDTARGRVVGSIPTAASPHGLRMSPDGREIYVAATKGNAVSVIDVATSREVIRIPIGKAPVQVGFTPDGTRVYVSLRDDNAVAMVDTRTRGIVTTIHSSQRGREEQTTDRGVHGVVVSDDGSRVFVANTFAGTVSTIDAATKRVIGTMRVGNSPGGITYRPAPR